ncbi:unnamed protein product [Adineta steineri]|uniref:NHL repeat containing protein n=1 Tax=Adineta steineri TaxID=433720 RepID=A0A819VJW8_9BILA|nr:unnamed protein product [Adineta steineri]CAF4110432.1 unnamed protein product [Adineta steineri]
MNQNRIGSEPVTSNSQQTSADRSTLLIKCLKKKKLLWIIIGIITVILVVTIPTAIIKTKKTNEIKLSTMTTETTNVIKLSTLTTKTTTHEFTTTVANPTTTVQNKPKYNKWKQHGITIAGGNGYGDLLNQLAYPVGISIDDNNSFLIADTHNHRIIEWKYNSIIGEIIAGGNNGPGNREDQLNTPTDVIVDKEKNAIIICDSDNTRVMRWFRGSTTYPETIIANIHCGGVATDKDQSLYVSDYVKSEVRRWKEGHIDETLVAGGNGKGSLLNQFNGPGKIVVDEDYSIYVSDQANHRIMKWKKDAKEGIIVAGGNGDGSHLNQLSFSTAVIVDNFGLIFISDYVNHRVIRWSEGDTNGTIVVGGNGSGGGEPNQLNFPRGLSFDVDGNLYVADSSNYRIQKYELCTE